MLFRAVCPHMLRELNFTKRITEQLPTALLSGNGVALAECTSTRGVRWTFEFGCLLYAHQLSEISSLECPG